MKVGRSYLGQVVVLKWMDPTTVHTHVRSEGPPKRGRCALALQTEIGRIDDISEEIVRMCYTETIHPGETEIGEYQHTYIHEALITEITAYTPQVGPPKEGP